MRANKLQNEVVERIYPEPIESVQVIIRPQKWRHQAVCLGQIHFHVLTHYIVHKIKHCFIQTNAAHRKQFGTTDADDLFNVD